MANLESFKDIRTVASVSALVAVGISSSYFYNEIAEIKKEQSEMKKHLASVISISSPDTSKNVHSLSKAVEHLDSRLAKTLEDIKILRQNAALVDSGQAPKRVYSRLTQKNDDLGYAQKPKFVSQHVEKEMEIDDEDDIAAMMS